MFISAVSAQRINNFYTPPIGQNDIITMQREHNSADEGEAERIYPLYASSKATERSVHTCSLKAVFICERARGGYDPRPLS